MHYRSAVVPDNNNGVWTTRPDAGDWHDRRVGLEHQFVALDLETTGLMAETDRIVEIGAVRFLPDGREIGRFQRLVNPQRPMSPAAYAIHGLSDADLADAAPAREILPEFLSFLGDADSTALIAHNAAFDAGFLGRELSRAGLPRRRILFSIRSRSRG